MKGLDDRMNVVIDAYYQAVAAGDDALAARLWAAIAAADIEAGLAILEEAKP